MVATIGTKAMRRMLVAMSQAQRTHNSTCDALKLSAQLGTVAESYEQVGLDWIARSL
jgi:hypothetical protein